MKNFVGTKSGGTKFGGTKFGGTKFSGMNSGGRSYAETNCVQTRKLFSPYLDGRVSGSEMHALRLHLEQCATCAREYAAMQRSQQLLANLGPKRLRPTWR